MGTASNTLNSGPSTFPPLSLAFGSPAEKNESTGRSRDSFEGSPELDGGPALGAGVLFLVVRPSRSLFSPPRLSPLKLQLTGLPVVTGLFVVGKLADLGFSLVGIVGLAVGGLVGAGVVIFLRKVGLRVTTTCVGAALGLRVVRVRLGVGLFGAAGGALVGVLAGGRLEATLGKAVKGVTTTEEPGRGVGLPKPVLLLSKLPAPDERLGKVFCPSPNCASNCRTFF